MYLNKKTNKQKNQTQFEESKRKEIKQVVSYWHRIGIDVEINEIESKYPKINPCIYCQLIFQECAKIVKWGEEQPLQHTVLSQLDVHGQ